MRFRNGRVNSRDSYWRSKGVLSGSSRSFPIKHEDGFRSLGHGNRGVKGLRKKKVMC